jgi:hypothetical protein
MKAETWPKEWPQVIVVTKRMAYNIPDIIDSYDDVSNFDVDQIVDIVFDYAVEDLNDCHLGFEMVGEFHDIDGHLLHRKHLVTYENYDKWGK